MRKRIGISYTADNIVVRNNGNELELLVVKRKYPPFQGEWALPGGFIDPGEEPLTASLRELEEETALILAGDRAISLSVREKEDRDPRGRVITYPFLFWLKNEESSVVAGDDAAQAEWIPLLKLGRLAFDHGAILCEALGMFWPNMASYESRLEGSTLPDLFYKKREQSSVYFGGSFNPWHAGHGECLDQCLEAQGEYDIIIVPDFNPWKSGTVEGERCFFQSYLKLAKIVKECPYSIFSGFWGAEKPNPTISWLPNTYDKSKALLIGDDNFLKIDQWKDFEKLLSSIQTLYVVPREHPLDRIKEMQSWLSTICLELQIEILEEHRYQHLSSTELRGH
ncbi:MAG: NUDIX domain-containing protein [Bacteriovoracaceae bacterium]|nr:NUDIX domain-containing protein [Bacteriovoracaceae bacterium]